MSALDDLRYRYKCPFCETIPIDIKGVCDCLVLVNKKTQNNIEARITELEQDNHRLAQENIKLNNNEDFLDGRIAEQDIKIASLEARLAAALERNVKLQSAINEATPIMVTHGFWKAVYDREGEINEKNK